MKKGKRWHRTHSLTHSYRLKEKVRAGETVSKKKKRANIQNYFIQMLLSLRFLQLIFDCGFPTNRMCHCICGQNIIRDTRAMYCLALLVIVCRGLTRTIYMSSAFHQCEVHLQHYINYIYIDVWLGVAFKAANFASNTTCTRFLCALQFIPSSIFLFSLFLPHLLLLFTLTFTVTWLCVSQNRATNRVAFPKTIKTTLIDKTTFNGCGKRRKMVNTIHRH